MSIESYRDLKVWQRGMEIAEAIYKITSEFPKAEQFGIACQMQRAAVSIPSNLAEGHDRGATKDFLRFISMTLGSRAELETQLLLAKRLTYGNPERIHDCLAQLDELGRMLRGLQKSLRAKLD